VQLVICAPVSGGVVQLVICAAVAGGVMQLVICAPVSGGVEQLVISAAVSGGVVQLVICAAVAGDVVQLVICAAVSGGVVQLVICAPVSGGVVQLVICIPVREALPSKPRRTSTENIELNERPSDEPDDETLDDMGRRGHILWIRGLTRLQTQVGTARCRPARTCFMFVCLCTSEESGWEEHL